jgi:hypothetical protein
MPDFVLVNLQIERCYSGCSEHTRYFTDVYSLFTTVFSKSDHAAWN